MRTIRVIDTNPLSIVDIQKVRREIISTNKRVTFYENNCSDVVFIPKPELNYEEIDDLRVKFPEYKISFEEKSQDDFAV